MGIQQVQQQVVGLEVQRGTVVLSTVDHHSRSNQLVQRDTEWPSVMITVRGKVRESLICM